MPLLSIHSHRLHEDDHKNAERKGKKRKFHSVKSESCSGGWDKEKDAGWWTQCGNYKCKKLIESQHEIDAADWGNKRRSCPTTCGWQKCTAKVQKNEDMQPTHLNEKLSGMIGESLMSGNGIEVDTEHRKKHYGSSSIIINPLFWIIWPFAFD